MEPVDTNVAAGQDATLHCQADGYPTPIITWKKAIGNLFIFEIEIALFTERFQTNNPVNTRIFCSSKTCISITTVR